jgi:hypothetical protein
MNSATTLATDVATLSDETKLRYVQCRCGQLSLVREGQPSMVCRDCGRWHGLRWSWEPEAGPNLTKATESS